MTFPSDRLRPTDTALALFSAHWLGRQDAVFLRDAGLSDVTCVDNDAAKLAEMMRLYPETWKFVCADAFAFVGRAFGEGRKWSVCVSDQWTQHEDAVLAILPMLLGITSRLLVVGISMPRLDALGVSPGAPTAAIHGVTGDLMKRSDHLGWTGWWVVSKAPVDQRRPAT